METMTFKSPVGPLKLLMDDEVLVRLEFSKGANQKFGANLVKGCSKVSIKSCSADLLNVCEQLEQYFEDPAWVFEIKLQSKGTEFQRRVWRGLQKIKPGKPLTYGDLAKKLKTGPRAIGGACRANPVPVIVPCHRVIAANSQGGFCGDTTGFSLTIKDWLLEHESAVSLA